MNHRLRDREEGQIVPALLLVVVVLVFFGLVFAQVGSAAEQKTQTQTAADAAAVAGAHQKRDGGLSMAAFMISNEFWFTQQFRVIFRIEGSGPAVARAACSAAQQNWEANPHRNDASLTCGSGQVRDDIRAVHLDLLAPRDQVAHGPLNDSPSGQQLEDERARATATARVSMSHCPRGLLNYTQKAVADWVADQALMNVGAIGDFGSCLTSDEATYLANLESNPIAGGLAALHLGPPQPIVNAVRDGLYAELVD